MQTVSLSSPRAFSLHKNHILSLKPPLHESSSSSCRLPLHLPRHSTFLRSNPLLRGWSNCGEMMMMKKKKKKMGRGYGPVCSLSAPLTPDNLQWISAVSTTVLMLARGTGIQKSFLVPFFALQAPPRIISWIKGEYGMWTAFLALLVRLFYYIPGELELPFVALLLVIVSPYQAMNLRGTQVGVILSLVIAVYLAFQHFSCAGSLRKAFDQGSIVATIAIICIFAVPCLLLMCL